MDPENNIFLEIKEKINRDDYTLKSRLLRFYKTHCPEKIENIDNIVKKYSNKEKELFKNLVSIYGKETPLCNDEKAIINKRLKLQREHIENKKKLSAHLQLEKERKKIDYLDIYTYPYDKNTIFLLEKIESYKGNNLPPEILSQI